jgi:hypothetical protein
VIHDEWTDFIFGCEIRKTGIGLSGGREAESPFLPRESAERDGNGVDTSLEDALLSPFTFSSFRNFYIMYCSFVDGLDRGLRLPIIYILKTKYMLSQAVAFTAFGVSMSPWLVKPYVAVVTDTVPVFGLKRKPYVIGSAWINGISLGAIGAVTATQLGGYLLPMSLMTVRTFCRCVTGSVIQGMLLEDCHEGGQALTSGLISQYHTAHRFGQFASVAASGLLLSTGAFLSVFLSIGAFHAGSIGLSMLLEESPAPNAPVAPAGELIPRKLQELKDSVAAEPGFGSLLEYAFWAMANPNYEARMAYYLLDERHFTVWQLSLVSTAQTVASLVTPSMYNFLFSDAPLRPLLRYFTIATVPASLMPLFLTTGASDALLLNPVLVASVSGFFLTSMNDLQMMPANVLVARIARKGLEGSMFSVFTVTEGLGRVASEFYVGLVPVALGAAAWNKYANMSLYIATSSFFQLAPIPATWTVPDRVDRGAVSKRPTYDVPSDAVVTDIEEL